MTHRRPPCGAPAILSYVGARRSCPVSTGGGTRRVQLVREGRGGSRARRGLGMARDAASGPGRAVPVAPMQRVTHAPRAAQLRLRPCRDRLDPPPRRVPLRLLRLRFVCACRGACAGPACPRVLVSVHFRAARALRASRHLSHRACAPLLRSASPSPAPARKPRHRHAQPRAPLAQAAAS